MGTNDAVCGPHRRRIARCRDSRHTLRREARPTATAKRIADDRLPEPLELNEGADSRSVSSSTGVTAAKGGEDVR
jgi:hypothetical protein